MTKEDHHIFKIESDEVKLVHYTAQQLARSLSERSKYVSIAAIKVTYEFIDGTLAKFEQSFNIPPAGLGEEEEEDEEDEWPRL